MSPNAFEAVLGRGLHGMSRAFPVAARRRGERFGTVAMSSSPTPCAAVVREAKSEKYPAAWESSGG